MINTPPVSYHLSGRKRRRLHRVVKSFHTEGYGAETNVRAPRHKKVVVKIFHDALSARSLAGATLTPMPETYRDIFAAEAARLIMLKRKMGRHALKTWVDAKRGWVVQEYVPEGRIGASTAQLRTLDRALKRKGLDPWDAGSSHPQNNARTEKGRAVVMDLGGVEFKKTPENLATWKKLYLRLRA